MLQAMGHPRVSNISKNEPKQFKNCTSMGPSEPSAPPVRSPRLQFFALFVSMLGLF